MTRQLDRRTLFRLSALGGAAAATTSIAARTAVAAPAAPAGPPTYLTGVLAPVPDEITGTNLTVDGTIPAELTGRYFRNGPNPHPGTDPGVWWSGAGMVHGIRLRAGQAEWYRNRWVRTLAGPPGDLRSGAANTNVVPHAGKILALYEVAFPYEITPELDTIGPVDFGGRLSTAMTAHPKEDPKTGELHFFGYAQTRPYLTYHRLSAGGDLVRSVPIDLPEPVLMHDFALTENHVLWLDLPTVWDAESQRSGFPSWSDAHQPRIGVMPRDGGSADVRWFPVDPRWAWHVGNAYEAGDGRIVLEAISGVGPEWLRVKEFFKGRPGGRVHGRLRRWVFDPRTGRVREYDLDDVVTEFPTINESFVGSRHRYVYSPTTPMSPTRHNRIVKHDSRGGGDRWHYLGQHRVAGEAVFVPARDARREDDGWLLTVVHDLTRPAASLMILDASEPAADPVATVHLPRQVPYGYHGCWIPDGVIG